MTQVQVTKILYRKNSQLGNFYMGFLWGEAGIVSLYQNAWGWRYKWAHNQSAYNSQCFIFVSVD